LDEKLKEVEFKIKEKKLDLLQKDSTTTPTIKDDLLIELL
jgi:hypothetical protein